MNQATQQATQQAANAAIDAETGLRKVESRRDVDATVAALQAAMKARGLRVFALINHATAAREAGLSMPPTIVIVFGNPKGGTPLMRAHPDLALDLPLRVLVRQSGPDRAEVLWHDSAAMERAQHLPAGTLDGLKPLDAMLQETVDALAR